MNIVARNLNFAYGRHEHVLKDINFEINEPKIYGLLGRNGAGKTSLLSIIGSFREPTSGELLIKGEAPFENAEVMQQVTFMYSKDFSSETENAKSLLKDSNRYRPNFDYDYALQLAEKFKLDLKKPLSKLSKGKQSIFNVIVALASRTPITIFDEVYLGMDAPARDLFYKELLKEQELHPRIMILSTHLVSEMDYLFDDVLIIKDGKLLLHESYEELLSRGVTLIGSKQAVDTFSNGKDIIHHEQLGDTHSVTLYGAFGEDEKQRAKQQGLQVGHSSLHDLFIQLTKEED
ncbi:ABC transporter ATP-binding protein [Oceanobacillus luteolus]|uniref:ATP-binding cassette domain-containing protein n=1 Tax=Oceanobacillus luteolus TaxID=1274358 RepID=A0ABW4HNW1_9BACI|nr:ABC transporter ATP-binding protein [Oceanobacillus luteolus]MCM3739487.1 ABC transporter ATP-binding protein [Oceanobacillus luteolus]